MQSLFYFSNVNVSQWHRGKSPGINKVSRRYFCGSLIPVSKSAADVARYPLFPWNHVHVFFNTFFFLFLGPLMIKKTEQSEKKWDSSELQWRSSPVSLPDFSLFSLFLLVLDKTLINSGLYLHNKGWAAWSCPEVLEEWWSSIREGECAPSRSRRFSSGEHKPAKRGATNKFRHSLIPSTQIFQTADGGGGVCMELGGSGGRGALPRLAGVSASLWLSERQWEEGVGDGGD